VNSQENTTTTKDSAKRLAVLQRRPDKHPSEYVRKPAKYY